MAGRVVDVVLQVGAFSTECALDLSVLTAALWMAAENTSLATEELMSGPSEELAALVLRGAMGLGGMGLGHIAEDFTLAAWSDEATPVELAQWNQCAALVEAMFGQAARLPKDMQRLDPAFELPDSDVPDVEDDAAGGFSVVLHGGVRRPFGWSDQDGDWEQHFAPDSATEAGGEGAEENQADGGERP